MSHSLLDSSADVSVGSVMTTDIVALEPGMRLTQAMSLFAEREHVAMPVVDEDRRLVGILSSNDLLRVLGRTGGHGQQIAAVLCDRELGSTFALRCTGATVGAVMTRSVVTVSERTSVADATAAMARHAVSCLPVVEGGRLTGLVTRDNLARRADGAPVRAQSRDSLLEREIQAEAAGLRPGEWLVARVHAGRATLEGRISDEARRLDLLRRIAAIAGVVRIEDRMEMALDPVW